MNKINTRIEFFVFEAIKGSQTLVLEKPAEITFINTGGGIADAVIINNNFRLSSTFATNSGVATHPNTLYLKNNNYEIDVTTYTIRVLGATAQCQVVVKYFDI